MGPIEESLDRVTVSHCLSWVSCLMAISPFIALKDNSYTVFHGFTGDSLSSFMALLDVILLSFMGLLTMTLSSVMTYGDFLAWLHYWAFQPHWTYGEIDMTRPRTYEKGARRSKILLTPESTVIVAKAWSIMLAEDPVNAPKDQTACVARLLKWGFAYMQDEKTKPTEDKNEDAGVWG